MKAITESAVLRRINRKLRRDSEVLRVCPYNSPDFHRLGRYYVVDERTNAAVQHDVDIAQLGCDVGAIRSNEVLVR